MIMGEEIRTGMEDQITLFAARARRKMKNICQLYVIFMVFAIVFMYLLSGGSLEEYRRYYLGFGVLTGITFLFLVVTYFSSIKTLEKEKEKFSNEELGRINREVAKGPKLEHILITQDVIGYHIGIRIILIPVRDIVWIKKSSVVHMRIHHAGGGFLPAGKKESLIDIRTRDGMIHHISNDLRPKLEEEIFNYLTFTVKMRRPGVIVGSDERWEGVSKEEFNEIVKRVDAIGSEDAGEVEMLYNQERLYNLCQSGIGDSRKTEVKLMAVVAVSYILAYCLFHYADSIVRFDNLLKQDLFSRMFQTFFVGIFVLLPPVLVIGSFFKNVLFDKERTPSLLKLAVYFVFGFLTISCFFIFLMMTKENVYGVEAVKDWYAYASNRLETYEGVLFQTESPVVDGMQIVTEEKYQYVEAGETSFKYYADCCVEPKLMQPDYRVAYTPNLQIMVSLTDGNGNERVALKHSDIKELQALFEQSVQEEKEKYPDRNTWQGGDLIFPKHEEIYGYDDLNEDEQMNFDLLYSDIFFDETEGVREFQLPEPLPQESFQKIKDLYESNHRYDSFFRYEYKTSDLDEVSKVYVSGTTFRVEEYNSYSGEYQGKAEQIAARIPENLDTEGKVRWITDYLLENVEAYNFLEWAENSDVSGLEYEKGIQSDTGYGALTYATASQQGYMEAFGMICQKAGIYTIAAIDGDEYKYWNLVEINGKWLAVNVGAMAEDQENQDKYYLIGNSDMEKQMEAKATYGLSEWFKLP